MTLTITDKQFRVLLEVLADYLNMVGADPDRKTRASTSKKLLEQWQFGESRRQQGR